MSSDRKLDQSNGNGNGDGGDAEYSTRCNGNEFNTEWMNSYSFSYVGCQGASEQYPHGSILFRMCPSESCSARRGVVTCDTENGGKDVGNYEMDLFQFMSYWKTTFDNTWRPACQYLMNDYCTADRYKDECARNWRDDSCIEACGMMTHINICVGDNNSNGYFAKQGVCVPSLYSDTYPYSLAPYCSEKTNEILLGLFIDDTCTMSNLHVGESEDPADPSMWQRFDNHTVEFSKNNMVFPICLSCPNSDIQSYNQQNDAYSTYSSSGNNNSNNDSPTTLCEAIYAPSDKCEGKLMNFTDEEQVFDQESCDTIRPLVYKFYGQKMVKKSGIFVDEHRFAVAAVVIAILAAIYFFVLHKCFGTTTSTATTKSLEEPLHPTMEHEREEATVDGNMDEIEAARMEGESVIEDVPPPKADPPGILS